MAGNIDLQVQKLDADAFAKEILGSAVKVQGRVNGQVKATLPAMPAAQGRAVALHVDLQAAALRVQNIPTEQLQASIVYHQGALEYRLKGNSLGGTFEVEGTAPVSISKGKEKMTGTGKGRISIQGVQLSRLLEALHFTSAAEVYRGRIGLNLSFTQSSLESRPVGSGRLRVTSLRSKDKVLSDEIAGDIVLSADRLHLRNVTSSFGEGLIRAQATLHFKRPEESRFTVDLDGVEATDLLGPWLGETIQGPLHARIRGHLGTEWSGSADLELARGKVLGLEISQWRVPLTFRIAPLMGRGEVQIPETSAQASSGRLTGKMSTAWEYTTRVEGQIRFTRVDLESLLRQMMGPTQVAGGKMTGRFDFAGREMRSLEDLTGTLQAAFEQSRALDFPVLRQVAPFVGVGSSTTFQKGELRARLDRGVFHVQRLALEGANLQLFMEGRVWLDGRLDLAVTANTANLPFDMPGLRLLGLRIPLLGPVPLGVLREASTLLSNRLIHLRVTGTIRNPIIRVNAFATLTQESVRYFLRRQVSTLPLNP